MPAPLVPHSQQNPPPQKNQDKTNTPSPFILLPLYIYPTPTSWQPLYNSITHHPHIHFKIIINPNSGPGTTPYPDANYRTAIATLNSHSNVETLGYVYVNYGKRAIPAVEADIARYAGWSDYAEGDIHVEGIFFDETPSAPESLAYMKSVAAYTKNTLRDGNRTVIMNPGTTPNPSYYNIADYISAYEAAYTTTTSGNGQLTALSAIPPARAATSCVIVHSYSAGVAQMRKDTLAFVETGVGGLFLTEGLDYNVWASWWEEFVGMMDGAVGVRVEAAGKGMEKKLGLGRRLKAFVGGDA